MTTAAKQTDAPVTKLAARRHKWGDPVYIHHDTAPSGCNETEKACKICKLVKITVHTPERRHYPAWRTAGGLRFPDTGQTPLCEGEARA